MHDVFRRAGLRTSSGGRAATRRQRMCGPSVKKRGIDREDDTSVAAGSPRRIVRPGGIDIVGRGFQCRGANLHVFINGAWYRIGLDALCRTHGRSSRPWAAVSVRCAHLRVKCGPGRRG
ncbi:hypothetical protein Athai_14270 [Actinocatenispora thailandica]|uniref:Uncharacterized protein n=1 Tax=Actinocatenispora thailandica TaxID=227318 RepID=A0A7R7DLG5_9ACTN|nr:hypothetical protein Athai_14270 [Actinocatenispora thailandica]